MDNILMRRRGMSLSGGGEISDYVQSGIMFWLDGIENTRNGHDASSTTWENLANSSYDVTYNSSKVIGDKYCIPNGRSDISAIPSSKPLTIEIVIDYAPNGDYQIINPWYGNSTGTVWFNKNYSGLFFGGGSGRKGIQPVTGITTYATANYSSVYVNGSLITGISGGDSWSYKYAYMFYYNSSYPSTFVSKIYAIRMYDRVLSDDELLKNAQVDTVRFK